MLVSFYAAVINMMELLFPQVKGYGIPLEEAGCQHFSSFPFHVTEARFQVCAAKRLEAPFFTHRVEALPQSWKAENTGILIIFTIAFSWYRVST